ncbi:hypothetical protein BJX63DRAFT_168620 [Aspergillus granulosus]|uniref:Uncharacterized protein n=1 Tax=Aspergillus granulosus TaxID=176169 RepID=A0ABR4GRK2_9EURO
MTSLKIVRFSADKTRVTVRWCKTSSAAIIPKAKTAKGASASGLSDGGTHSRCVGMLDVDNLRLSNASDGGWRGREKRKRGTDQRLIQEMLFDHSTLLVTARLGKVTVMHGFVSWRRINLRYGLGLSHPNCRTCWLQGRAPFSWQQLQHMTVREKVGSQLCCFIFSRNMTLENCSSTRMVFAVVVSRHRQSAPSRSLWRGDRLRTGLALCTRTWQGFSLPGVVDSSSLRFPSSAKRLLGV